MTVDIHPILEPQFLFGNVLSEGLYEYLPTLFIEHFKQSGYILSIPMRED